MPDRDRRPPRRPIERPTRRIDLSVNADVRAAFTLPATAYPYPELYAAHIERVFAPAWHLAPSRETGVHYSHRLLARALGSGN